MSSKESENSAALRVLNLRKTYKTAAAPALDGVTFEVGQGEFFGLLGPNGAGKSTLIGTVAGLVKPDAGSAYILGRDTVIEPRFTKMAVGIVPQEITFDPFFTVRETLRLQSGFYGIRHNDIWISTLIYTVDDICWRYFGQSSGMIEQVLEANPGLVELGAQFPFQGLESQMVRLHYTQQFVLPIEQKAFLEGSFLRFVHLFQKDPLVQA